MSFVRQLRDTARIERDDSIRAEMGEVAHKLDDALHNVFVAPTDENMQTLNGLWARGKRILSKRTAA